MSKKQIKSTSCRVPEIQPDIKELLKQIKILTKKQKVNKIVYPNCLECGASIKANHYGGSYDKKCYFCKGLFHHHCLVEVSLPDKYSSYNQWPSCKQCKRLYQKSISPQFTKINDGINVDKNDIIKKQKKLKNIRRNFEANLRKSRKEFNLQNKPLEKDLDLKLNELEKNKWAKIHELQKNFKIECKKLRSKSNKNN